MIPAERITAGWLMSGLQRAEANDTPPSGFEFSGLFLEPGQDPIPQLGRIFSVPPHCLAFEEALEEAIADRSLLRYERAFAERVMTGLIRLIDYFGSPGAVLHLLMKVERGEFRGVGSYLIGRIAAVAARQAERLRTRFEDALRRPDTGLWRSELVLPFLRAEIEADPATWLKKAVARENDLIDLRRTGINGLAVVLGPLCADQQERAVLGGLIGGEAPHDQTALDLLFGEGLPEARLKLTGATKDFIVKSDYDVDLVIGFYHYTGTFGSLIPHRRRGSAGQSTAEITERVSKAAEWKQLLVERFMISAYQPETKAA